ncbi:MAG: hypothetical protein E6868_16500 [Pantoea sp.]|uniref:hypothetical protein n=1 Tax=Enterobacterales TaxID=91347 RepID=UPI001ED2ABA9|nr:MULTISPECIES: hypothetical protein [Enterobacterales]EGT4441110.1 hypothetical protein [Cronobacter sakazakii]MDU1574839.1 hypothetical protein [Pantoea sp.]UNM56595.1 hypothetical protein MOQ97_19280 [Cronobacter sakazakii]
MKNLSAAVATKKPQPVAVLTQQQSPLRSVSIDIQNADKYANLLAEIYNGSVPALMEHDPKAAVRIATLFAEPCSTTDRAGMRIARLSSQLAHGGAI